MKRTNILTILVVVASSFMMFATPASAFMPDFMDPSKMMEKAVVNFLNKMISDFASQGFDLLSEYVISVTNINKIPSIQTFMTWSQMAASSLATLFFVKRLMEAMRDELTEEGTPNIAEILGSYVVSLALVFATPYLITNFLIPINNAFVRSVTGLGIRVRMYDDFIDVMIGYDQGLHITFLLLVWVIAFIAFTIVAAIRYVDLAIILIMGSLVATTYTNRSQVYATYWTEVISVVFIQSVHIVLAYFIIQWASEGTFMSTIFSLGATIVALRGPQVLRQFLYTSGTGGLVQGAGRFAAYRFLMKGAGR